MPTYGAWQDGLVHEYEETVASTASLVTPSRTWVNPALQPADAIQKAPSGYQGTGQVSAVYDPHVANDAVSIASAWEAARQAAPSTSVNIPPYPRMSYGGADELLTHTCRVDTSFVVMRNNIRIPAADLGQQQVQVAPPQANWPADAVGVEYHPDDTRLDFLNASVTDWGFQSAAFDGTGGATAAGLSLAMYVKAPGVVWQFDNLADILSLPAVAEHGTISLGSLNGLYGETDDRDIPHQLHLYIALAGLSEPTISGHVNMIWNWSDPWYRWRVQFRTARYRFVYADPAPPPPMRHTPHLRAVQRGDVFASAPRAVQNNSRQGSNRAIGFL